MLQSLKRSIGRIRSREGRPGRAGGARWAVAGGLAVVLLGAGGATVVPAVNAAVTGGDRDVFVPISPARLLDTRVTGNPLGAGEDRLLPMTGVAGIPADAKAVTVTLTADRSTDGGYLTAHPSDEGVGGTSTVNFVKGQQVANNVSIKLGPDGALKVFNQRGVVDLVVDVTGFFADHNFDDRYYTKQQAQARTAAGAFACSTGQYLQTVAADGTPTCGTDQNSGKTYTAGPGIQINGTTIQADRSGTSAYACQTGQYLNAIAADGTPTCATDQDTDTNTTYTSGNGVVVKPDHSIEWDLGTTVVPVRGDKSPAENGQALVDARRRAPVSAERPSVLFLGAGTYDLSGLDYFGAGPYLSIVGFSQDATTIIGPRGTGFEFGSHGTFAHFSLRGPAAGGGATSFFGNVDGVTLLDLHLSTPPTATGPTLSAINGGSVRIVNSLIETASQAAPAIQISNGTGTQLFVSDIRIEGSTVSGPRAVVAGPNQPDRVSAVRIDHSTIGHVQATDFDVRIGASRLTGGADGARCAQSYTDDMQEVGPTCAPTP